MSTVLNDASTATSALSTPVGWTDESTEAAASATARMKIERETHKLEKRLCREVGKAIVDFNMMPLDGIEFTRLVRTSPDTANPYLPIIMMTGHSEKSRVYEARDAGVTEFVVKPITAKAILDRIQAVIMRPRAFVKNDSYFGPDRRRTNTVNYTGPMRRSDDVQPEDQTDEDADEGTPDDSDAA